MGLGNATWARRWAWRPRAQAAPLTLEHRLLLACARPVPEGPRLQALVARGPDWPWLLRQVERWGLAPLVYTHLQPVAHAGHVPQSVLERLRHLSHRDTIYGVAQRQVLRATLVGLAEAGVPVIVLKGAALAALVYPAPALRPMRDLDLLVQPRDRARVEAVLRRLREAPAAGSDAPHGSSALGPERFAPLDIRDHLVSPRGVAWLPAAGAIPIADVWQRARPAQIVSVATLVLSPEDLLLHLALQLAEAGGFVGHVRTLCDIGATCWRYGEAIDWWALGTRATTYQVGKALYYCLRLARELVGADVPGGALTELRARCGHLPLEERFLAAVTRRALLAEGPATGLPARCYRLGMHLLATQRARDGVTVAWRLLGRAGQGRLRRLGRGPGLWPPHVAGAGSADFSLGAGPPEARSAGVSPQLGVSTPWPRAQDRLSIRISGMSARLPATALVLPIYRPRLEAEALAAVDRAFAVLRHGAWYLIAPQSLDTSFYEQRYGKLIVRFPDACFASVTSYSRLLLTDEFYAAFAQYEYMLVTQDDAYVLHDDLPYWLSRRLDYIGAPWPDGHTFELSMSPQPGIHGHVLRVYVGNGGFSLRRIAACRQLLAEFPEEVTWFRQNGRGEDQFFAAFGQLSQQFVLPTLRVAADFAWEVSLPRMHALCQGQLPMAIHGYYKYDPKFFAHTILPAASRIVK